MFKSWHLTVYALLGWLGTTGVQAATVACQGLTGLEANEIVSGTIFVQESASGPVDRVEFYVDDEYVNTEKGAPYTLEGEQDGVPNGYETAELSGGSHTIRAEVYDNNGYVCNNSLRFVKAAMGWQGLTAGQVVTGELFVQAVPSVTVTKVVFEIDGEYAWTENHAPYFLGGDNGNENSAKGYDSLSLRKGVHTLTATGYPSAGGDVFSATAEFTVVGTTGATAFSSKLSPYGPHETANTKSVGTIFDATKTLGLTLVEGFGDKRKDIIAMYRDFGIDLSLPGSEQGQYRPDKWSKDTPQPLDGDYRQPYSEDAPFYQKIPRGPRVELPTAYISYVSLATEGGSNTHQGYTIADKKDPEREVTQRNNPVTTYTRHVSPDAEDEIPVGGSDKHLSFIDGSDDTVVTCYHTRLANNGVDFDCDWAGWSELGTLGDQGGGTDAAKIPNLAMVLREGEATDPVNPIPHALSGPMGINWKAMVYPALGIDGNIDNINYGLVPYGGVVQLDPDLDLTQVTVEGRPLSLPAFRLLEALQDYGFYVLDNRNDDTPTNAFTSLGIWTTTTAEEFLPYKNGKVNGTGPSAGTLSVQDELVSVLERYRVYIVPPVVKAE
ncbi:Ig-like domain-containing protein [Candidatus Cyanaurora vandensis]|uniref:Ig-like domain-containing protein n=1 Tax=Candidatus Cyanaurora vandensis TaxID=2714958 RepID=UPI00257B992C|nr:Ig-like domain-containing protein [Candidatus Cyanaurora vandensis]